MPGNRNQSLSMRSAGDSGYSSSMDSSKSSDLINKKTGVICKVIFDKIVKKEFSFYDVKTTLHKYKDDIDLSAIKSGEGYNILHTMVVHNRLHLLILLVHFHLWKSLMKDTVPDDSASSFRGHNPLQIAESKRSKRFRDEIKNHERLFNSMSTFLKACHNDNLKEVSKMLKQQPQIINDRDSMKNNCLYWAIVSYNVELFTFLLDQKADATTINANKENLLHVACMLGHSKLINLLMTRCKLDVTVSCSNKRTPLERVAENGDIESLKKLLKCGVSITSCVLPFAASNGRLPYMKYILEDTGRYVDFDTRDNSGRSAMMKATETERYDIFVYTISKGASITATDLRKRTALHLSAENGHVKIAELLIEKGANINAQDCYTGAELCFLIRGKDKGRKAWHYVEVRRNVADIFLKKTRAGQVDVALYGTVVKSGWGDDPETGVVERVEKMFADRSNRPNAPPDITPLHMAIYKQQPHVAKLLIAKGADINRKDQFGLTPLHHCALRNDLATAVILEDQGADFDVKDAEGKTALDVAHMNGQTEMINFVEGKKYTIIAQQFLETLRKGLVPQLSPELLEQLRRDGKDVKRHNIDTLRDANIDINCALIDAGSGPIMKASDSDPVRSSDSGSLGTSVVSLANYGGSASSGSLSGSGSRSLGST